MALAGRTGPAAPPAGSETPPDIGRSRTEAAAAAGPGDKVSYRRTPCRTNSEGSSCGLDESEHRASQAPPPTSFLAPATEAAHLTPAFAISSSTSPQSSIPRICRQRLASSAPHDARPRLSCGGWRIAEPGASVVTAGPDHALWRAPARRPQAARTAGHPGPVDASTTV